MPAMYVTVALWLLCLLFVAGAFALRAFCQRNPVAVHIVLLAARAWARGLWERLWAPPDDLPPEPSDRHVDEPGDLKVLAVQESPSHLLVDYAYRDVRYAMGLSAQFMHDLGPEVDFDPCVQVVRVLRAQRAAGDIVLRVARAKGKVTDREHEQIVKLFGPFGAVQDPEGFFAALDHMSLFQDREPVFVTCLDHVHVLDFENLAIIRETTEA